LGDFLGAPTSTRFLDRNGQLLDIMPLAGGLMREFTPLSRMPPRLREAFIAAEDRRFFWHPGIDPLAVGRAVRQNRRSGRTISGASTITMQLARMIRKRGEGWRAKMGEAWDALRLEARLPKRRILELYLNHVPFGFQAEGVTSGARLYFGRSLEDLRPEEMLLLTVIPRRPALYTPIGNPGPAASAALALARTTGLGGKWGLPATERGFVERLRVARGWEDTSQAPHFLRFLAKYHPAVLDTAAAKTTIDLELQRKLVEALRTQVWAYARQRMTTGAGIVFDNHNGDILAYVGSVDWYDRSNEGQNDGVLATNQPGSCLKPFLYALAMESGFTANAILPDIPQDFGGAEVYVPANFNRRFSGPVRLRVALASSLNVPAVSLLQRLGVQPFADFLLTLGFSSLEGQRGHLGVGLALGNAEVSLFELARAFSIFPRGGVPLTARMLVSDPSPAPARPLIGEYTAAEICRILSDQPSRFLGFGSARAMNTSFAAMFKTGTANQFQHVWALGATPDYTVGVWMGNFSGETIIGRTGSGIPARVVVDILSEIARPDASFPVPPGSRRVTVCTLSGGAPNGACPSTTEEFLPENAVVPPCSYHRMTAQGTQTSYPPEYAAWLREGRKAGLISESSAEEGLQITQPVNGAVYFLDPSMPSSHQGIGLQTAGTPAEMLQVWVNGSPLESLQPDGSAILPLTRGEYRVEIRGSDGRRVWDRVQYSVR
jgi:penicillin-binding protein 1C